MLLLSTTNSKWRC
uniref:Uncharacterized protein n=1 Tax=Arundo donax TaxID=35708 RepID=A0A0A9GRX1_ARUDO